MINQPAYHTTYESQAKQEQNSSQPMVIQEPQQPLYIETTANQQVTYIFFNNNNILLYGLIGLVLGILCPLGNLLGLVTQITIITFYNYLSRKSKHIKTNRELNV